MRLLVVEDDPDLRRTLQKALGEENFAVDVSPDGDDVLFSATEIAYDAIVLDLMLPGRDGWSILESLRQAGLRTPVLVLTARDGVHDRVRGLNLGADDYLTKPFALPELSARLRALIRRSIGQPSPGLSIGDVRIDTAASRVYRAGAAIELTAREYAILELLARRRGELVSRTTICDHIYGDSADVFSNVIDVHVASLRRKLGPDLIRTRRGFGYCIDA
jgi:two-component system OmpR family response regulator